MIKQNILTTHGIIWAKHWVFNWSAPTNRLFLSRLWFFFVCKCSGLMKAVGISSSSIYLVTVFHFIFFIVTLSPLLPAQWHTHTCEKPRPSHLKTVPLRCYSRDWCPLLHYLVWYIHVWCVYIYINNSLNLLCPGLYLYSYVSTLQLLPFAFTVGLRVIFIYPLHVMYIW